MTYWNLGVLENMKWCFYKEGRTDCRYQISISLDYYITRNRTKSISLAFKIDEVSQISWTKMFPLTSCLFFLKSGILQCWQLTGWSWLRNLKRTEVKRIFVRAHILYYSRYEPKHKSLLLHLLQACQSR